MCLLNAATGDPKLDLDIDYNPFDCDCRDYSIISHYRFFSFAHWLDRVNCDAPPELYNTKVCISYLIIGVNFLDIHSALLV